MRCEDYPCCGHTPGDPCPDRDRHGRIIARCVDCGKRLPAGARSSICARCQRRSFNDHGDPYGDDARDY